MALPDDDPGPGATEDGAFFAPIRVKGTRRPRILASLVFAGVGALIAIGALDRKTPSPSSTIADTSVGPSATLVAQATKPNRPPPRASLEVPGRLDGGDAASLMNLVVTPDGSDLFIHGEVFSLDVARVSVRIEDPAGHVAASR